MHTSLHQSDTETSYSIAKSSVGWCRHTVDVLTAYGADRTDLLQRMTTNEMSPLSATNDGETVVGTGVQTVFVNDKARILDVATVVALEDTHRIVCSSGMAEILAAWLEKYTFIDDFRTTDDTQNYASFLVFGPRSLQLLNEFASADLRDLRTHHAASVVLHGTLHLALPAMVIKQPTLCDFCWLVLVETAREQDFRDLIQSVDATQEVHTATFETLRIEAAWGKRGAEWTDAHNPLEAGLVTAVSFTKGCYIGQEVIARLDTYNKVKVRLMGFTAAEAIPAGSTFVDESDGKRTEIGEITSSTFSPELGRHIALGYIRSQFANPGVSVEAVFEGAVQRVEIVKLPFVM
jgi:tRNA-modifying protein YgfZ